MVTWQRKMGWKEILLRDRVARVVGKLAIDCVITKRGTIRVDADSVETAKQVLAILRPSEYKRYRSHKSVYVYGQKFAQWEALRDRD